MLRRLVSFFTAALLCCTFSWIGLWFMPFVVGVWFGALPPRRGGSTVPVVTAGAVAGWAVSLWTISYQGLPAGATARAIAALAGLPPYAAVTIAVTLLLAALQALAGSWLARAVFPRRRDAQGPAAPPMAAAVPGDQGGPPGSPGPPAGSAQT
ncbi:MAG TPA: hypothetical protein VGM12_09700 [Trebonia sp.]|jgi:hypothetical protein